MCSGKVPQSPAELFSPCQAPTKATAFQLLLGCGFPAAQPGGWMFSPLLGACTDSCVRQNPDCRAWSIKLPIRPLQSPAKRLPWRHVRPKPGHPGWRGAQEGRPGLFQTHPDVSSHTSGRTESGRRREARGHPIVWRKGRWRETGTHCQVPHTGLGSAPRVCTISPPLSSPPDDTCPTSLTFLHIKIIFLFPIRKDLGGT